MSCQPTRFPESEWRSPQVESLMRIAPYPTHPAEQSAEVMYLADFEIMYTLPLTAETRGELLDALMKAENYDPEHQKHCRIQPEYALRLMEHGGKTTDVIIGMSPCGKAEFYRSGQEPRYVDLATDNSLETTIEKVVAQ